MEADNLEASEGNEDEDFDPINDIIDYLVRCAKISFKNARVDKAEVRTSEKIQMAHELYQRSPVEFLMQFGNYLAPHHINYFEKIQLHNECEKFRQCVSQLRYYHSEDSRRKRVRNRRFKALQKLQHESDYFSEKQMMYRNPLLYEQLVGQYLTDEEIRERDGVDNENLTFLSMILETVDRNQMRETKNEQMLEEDLEDQLSNVKIENHSSKTQKAWGEFEIPDTRPNYIPEKRKQATISAPERKLLREEFLQEMYSNFLEGTDPDVDYNTIDNDEQYDDLQQVSQDAEDKYFDSETNDIENLEEHMKLVEVYGGKKSNDNSPNDPLDVFMSHISNKLVYFKHIRFYSPANLHDFIHAKWFNILYARTLNISVIKSSPYSLNSPVIRVNIPVNVLSKIVSNILKQMHV